MPKLFIDVREPSEYANGHVKGAINLPPSLLMSGAKLLADVPKDTELILYCMTGTRSNASMHFLKRLGYTNLVNGINKDHVAVTYSVSTT